MNETGVEHEIIVSNKECTKDEWIAVLDEDSGMTYYANLETDETSWDKPQGFIDKEDNDRIPEVVKDEDHMYETTAYIANKGSASDEDENCDQESSMLPVVDDEVLRTPGDSTIELQPVPVPVFSVLPTETQVVSEKSIKSNLTNSATSSEYPMIEYVKTHYNLHFKSRFGKTSSKTIEEAISWQKEMLKTSVRHLPPDLVPNAKQAFRNISGFMGSRSTGKRQNDHCLKLIRNVMATAEEIRDEVYCQICKQTTKNPSVDGTLRGWQLMNICLATFAPTDGLESYLSAYCEWNTSSSNELINRQAKACVLAIKKIKEYEPRCEIPCMKEIEAIMDLEEIKLPVYLLDGSYKTMSINSWTTSAELSMCLSKSLGIQQSLPFAVYEVSSDEKERLLEPHERILDLYAQWQRLQFEQKSKTKRHGDSVQDYMLVYKVLLYIDVDEDQTEEINMMYIQTVHDVTHGIYSCSIDDYTQLAAIQLQHTFGDYKEEYIVNLVDHVEIYVPAELIDGGKSNDIVGTIVEKYSSMPSRSKQQAKLAYLKICSSWRAYGSTFFVIQNTRNRTLPHDLILAVNYKGVHLMDPESKEFLVTHLYVDIVSWGYSSNGFVIVAGSTEKEIKHYYKTKLGQSINEMVNSYVNAIVQGASSG